jgi:hypothetical protein
MLWLCNTCHLKFPSYSWLAHSNIFYIASEEHAEKVKRGRHLKKKHQVDSSEEKIEDSSCKPTIRRKRHSIFDSGSEDEEFLSIEEVSPSLAKKTNGKVSKEIKPENGVSKEETKKESRNERKRKSDSIKQDPASPMYISASYFYCISVSIVFGGY